VRLARVSVKKITERDASPFVSARSFRVRDSRAVCSIAG
jgi:hypothetical protein